MGGIGYTGQSITFSHSLNIQFSRIRSQGPAIDSVPENYGRSKAVAGRHLVAASRAKYGKSQVVFHVIADLWYAPATTIMKFHFSCNVQTIPRMKNRRT